MTYLSTAIMLNVVTPSVVINPIMMTVIILNIVMVNNNCLFAKFTAVTYGCNKKKFALATT
jgi:hypothetical protein